MTEKTRVKLFADCKPGAPLLCCNPAGEIIRRIFFPVRRVISVAFGGGDGSAMFVTTAHEGAPKGDHDGGVFLVENTLGGAEEFCVSL